MSGFDLQHARADIRDAVRRHAVADLSTIAHSLAQQHAETVALLAAAEWTLAHLRADTTGVDALRDAVTAQDDPAEATEIARLLADDYDTLHAQYVATAAAVDAAHTHADGAGGRPWCSVCVIAATLPVRVVDAARANQKGATP
jgi:hypothetical protein